MNISENKESEQDDLECMHVTSMKNMNEPCILNCKINGKEIQMTVDCGASVSVMSKIQYSSMFKKVLRNCSNQLVVINGSKLRILGEVDVSVELNDSREILKLFVLDSDNSFTPLIGRPWLDVFFPRWRFIFSDVTTVVVRHFP